MRNCAVGFSRPKSKFAVLSLAIRAIENTPYSHIFMKMGDLIIQSNHIGTTICHIDTFLEKHIIVESVPIDLHETRLWNALRIVSPYLGKSYGMLQLIGILLTKLLGIDKNPFKSGYICSELIYLILHDLYGIKLEKDPNLITPKDVYNLLISQDNIHDSRK